MYTFGIGSLSTVSLKNRETALNDWRIYGNTERVCVMMCSRMSRFNTAAGWGKLDCLLELHSVMAGQTFGATTEVDCLTLIIHGFVLGRGCSHRQALHLCRLSEIVSLMALGARSFWTLVTYLVVLLSLPCKWTVLQPDIMLPIAFCIMINR